MPKLASSTQREAAAATFMAQAKAISTFRHKSFLPVNDHFSEAGRHFIVTDASAGDTLDSVLAEGIRSFSAAEVSEWVDSILDVLQRIHSFRPSMNYPFLRPWNVLIGPDGQARLLASGTFRFDPSVNAAAPVVESETTISYSPIEQIWNGLDAASQKVIINTYDEASEKVLKQQLDARSDLFSLGALMYHLLTGRRPVDALERSIEIIDGNGDPLESPHAVDSSIPVEISDVVMKSMELKREYRFDSAAIMRQVLKTALVRARERTDTDTSHATTTAVNTPEPRKILEKDPIPTEAAPLLNVLPDNRSTTEPATSNRSPAAEILADAEDDLLELLSQLEDPKASARGLEKAPTAKGPVNPEPKELVAIDSAETETPENNASVTSKAEPAIEELVSTPHPAPTAENRIGANSDYAADFNELDSYEPPARFGLPAFAAAGVVLFSLLFGGWYYFSSRPTPAAATSTEAPASSRSVETEQKLIVPADEPAQAKPAVTTEAAPAEPDSAAIVDSPGPKTETSKGQSVSALPKNKKPVAPPAKGPAKKKTVTVDDLINDN